jgi:hypothetical protein
MDNFAPQTMVNFVTIQTVICAQLVIRLTH